MRDFRKTIRAKVGLISIAVVLISTGVTCIGAYGKMANSCVSSTSATFKFHKASYQLWEVTEMRPCKGKVYARLYQSAGKNGTKYTIYVKRTTDKKWSNKGTLSCKNGQWTASKKIIDAYNSATKYQIKVVKTNNLKNPSTVKVQYLLR